MDDLEATYRKKGQRKYKGYGVNLSETCDPENELQLITQVQVAPNTVDDTQLLSEGLPNLKERTEVEVLYTDGGYAGLTIDPVQEQCQVEQIPTGICGREPNPDKFSLSDFELKSTEAGHPEKITCPQGQTVTVMASKRQKSFQADFDPQISQTCPFHHEGRCPAHPGKKRNAFRLTFSPAQISVTQRRRKMRWREGAGKNPRAAIEGTIRQVKHPFPRGKLPVRGLFGVTTLMMPSAAMTNVRRIHHYLERKRMAVERLEDQNQKENAKSAQSSSSFWLLVSGFQELSSSLVMFRKLRFEL